MTVATRPLLPRPRGALAALTVATILLAGLAVGAAARSEERYDPSEEIAADKLRSDVFWLADDARQGRGVTSDGLDAAAHYIAERFRTLGLAPLDGMDGYFQPFDLPFGSELREEDTSLAAEGVRALRLGEDFMPLAWSPGRRFEGELAFAGYGIDSERHDYSDYAGLDARGKVVLVMNFEPHGKDGMSRFSGTARPSREGSLLSKARAAHRAGAVALLVVNPPLHHGDGEPLMAFEGGSEASEIPVFNINRATAEALLTAAGLPELRTLQEAIDALGRPVRREPSRAVKVTGGFVAVPGKVAIKNVVAVLPGEKAEEYVVVGAHYDHLGMGDYGTRHGPAIHNGADDNASGTAALLALAEAFAKNPQKPQRSILFVAITAEELGLSGSRHFVEHPPVPLAEMVAMVNLDMVGRVRESRLHVGGRGATEAFGDILAVADAGSPLALLDMGDEFGNRSDHYNFVGKGIPAIFFFSGLHEHYHSPQDDPPLINYEGMEQAVELAYTVIEAIDRTPRRRLAIRAPQPREIMSAGPATRPASEPDTRPAADAADAAAPGRAETDFRELLEIAQRRLDAERAAAPQESAITVSIDGRMELLSVIFRLAGSEEFGSDGLRPYAAYVDARFSAHAQHPAVAFARRMRQEVGVGADGVVVLAAHLSPLPALEPPPSFEGTAVESRWRRGDAGRFAELARDFARESNFSEFLSRSRPVHELASMRMRRLVARDIQPDWFAQYFGERPASRMHLAVGLLNGPISYGFGASSAGQPSEPHAVMGTWLFDEEGLPAFDESITPTLVHEFCHSFVDPAVVEHAADFEAAGKALAPALAEHLPRMRQYYWRTLFEESLVRAVVARYLLERSGREAARAELDRQAANGFAWIDGLYALLEQYEQDRRQYPTFEQFLPRVVGYFTDLPERLPGMIEAPPRAQR